jgi:hypothetical protein
MLMFKERRPAIRTLRVWAISVLHGAPDRLEIVARGAGRKIVRRRKDMCGTPLGRVFRWNQFQLRCRPVHTRARLVSKSKNKARALWYLAPTRDFSRPSITTFPQRSRTRHSQSLRFGLIATSKGARSSIRNWRP